MEAKVAFYKYSQYLSQSNDSKFDGTYSPGTPAPYSGIYRCDGCGSEAACNVTDPLPPQNHHQHSIQQGSIRWRLIVW